MNTVIWNDQIYSPSKIVCVGRNYSAHAKELGNAVPAEPVIFMKPNSAISEILLAHHNEHLHYETELCFLVKNSELSAVGLGLDLTKRQLQTMLKQSSLPWERAKAFDGSALFSHFIDLPEAWERMSFTLTVDDVIIQQGCISDMLFPPQKVLSFCQGFSTMEDGDLLMTGTPEGVGEVKSGALYQVVLYCNDEVLLTKSWLAK